MLPPVALIAKQLGVSRTHVNRMLGDAEREGLIRRDGEYRVIFNTEMQAAVQWVICSQLIALLVCAAKCEVERRDLASATDMLKPAAGELAGAIGQQGA
jgi:DNA-binding Lrp family transcriptional regulator